MNNIYITLIILLIILFILYNFSYNQHKESFDIAMLEEPFKNKTYTCKSCDGTDKTYSCTKKEYEEQKKKCNTSIRCPDGSEISCKKNKNTCFYKCSQFQNGKLRYLFLASKKYDQQNGVDIHFSKNKNTEDWISHIFGQTEPTISITISEPNKLGFKLHQVYAVQFQYKCKLSELTDTIVRDIVSISQADHMINNQITITNTGKEDKYYIYYIQFEFKVTNENKPLYINIHSEKYVTKTSPIYIGNIFIYNINKILDNIPVNSDSIIFYLCTLMNSTEFKKKNSITQWANISDNVSQLYNQTQQLTFEFDMPTSWNPSNGLIINNNTLIGPDGHLLDLKQLTNISVLWYMSANQMNNSQFLNIDAGDMTGLQIWFNTNNRNQLEINVKLKTNEYTFIISGYMNEMLYILTISGNDINLYANGTNISSSPSKNNSDNPSSIDINITNKPLVVNKNKNCNLILYTLSMFKKSLSTTEIAQLKKVYDIQFSFLTDPSISSKILNQTMLSNPDISSHIGLSNVNYTENNKNDNNLLDSFYNTNIIGYSSNPATESPYFIKNNKCKVNFDNKEDICYTFDIHKESMNGDNITKVGKCVELEDKEEYTANCCDIPLTNIQNKMCGKSDKCTGGENVIDALQSIDNIYSITYEKLPDGKIIKRVKKKNKKCKKE